MKKQRMIAAIVRTLLLVIIACVLLLPIVLTIVNSFMGEREIKASYSMIGNDVAKEFVLVKWIPDWVTFDQYFALLIKTSVFLQMFWNSVSLVVPIICGQVIVAVLAAFAFGKLQFKGKDPLFMVYLITMLMPYQVTLVPNFIRASQLGLLNHHSSIILPGIFGAFGVFLLRQSMLHIPSGYIEAPKIDGAGYGRILLTIVLPMVKPGVAALVVLLFIDNWNMVEQPLIFLQDPGLQPLSIFLSQIEKDSLGLSFAASVLFMSPMLLLFLSAERYFIEGIQLSGIKG